MRTSNTLFLSPTHNTFTPKNNFFRHSLHLLSSLLVLLSVFSFSTLAQVNCVDPGGVAVVTVSITNPPGAGGGPPQDLTATLPGTGHTIIANSCVATVGTCTIAPDGQSVTWNGNLANNETATLIYRVKVAASTPNGITLPITNTSTVAGVDFPAVSNLVTGCQATAIPTARVSDQKPGSVLVYPYYISNAAGTDDTRISMTNSLSPSTPKAYQAYVHVFLVDGASCLQTDFFVCLTPGATYTFLASETDPDIEGYVVAVAVDGTFGLPAQNNVLIGNAFVNTVDPVVMGSGYFGNYGAESFAANSSAPGSLYADYGTTAKLFFDGIGYDAAPKEFAVEIQSPVDVPAPFQKIVTAGLNGDLSTGEVNGALQVGSGQIINQNEDFKSVNNILSGDCKGQAIGTISDNLRVAGKLSNLIKMDMSGTVKFKVGGAVGLLLTPRNEQWGGIRTLHKTATTATCLIIPVFSPGCPTL